MITVRELIIKLLEFNLDANVSILALYDESENINITWIDNDGGNKKTTKWVFLETDNNRDNEENESVN